MRFFILFLWILFTTGNVFAAPVHRSDLRKSVLRERPLALPWIASFQTQAVPGKPGGFDELLEFILPSPDQEDAGSCLYMSITGIAEWWLARLNPSVSRAPNGPIDLSERYLMNMGKIEEDHLDLKNWRTDTILYFNKIGHKSVQNTAYPFAKGAYLGTVSDETIKPVPYGTEGSSYGTDINWYDDTAKISTGYVALPKFTRQVIFEDNEKNQWNIGVTPSDIVLQVKNALVANKAPVQVIYNHNGYWHSVYVIGFNDEMDNGKCAYTESFRRQIKERQEYFEREAAEAQTPGEKAYFETRARRAKEASDKIETAYLSAGGCTSSKGVFYIRDSIYPDYDGPVYDYDSSRTGDEAPYSKPYVTKEYDWLRYFANNIVQVFAN